MKPTGSDAGADFDLWLHRQLRSALDPQLGAYPHPPRARYRLATRHGGSLIPLRFSMTAALAAKTLVGSAVVALAAGAIAGTATTRSVNPVSWGQHVAEAVEHCKAPDANVGKCVSAIAQEHGEQVRAQHSEAVEPPGASPKPGQREGQEGDQAAGQNGSGDTAGAAHAQGQPAAAHDDHGHGKPSPHP